MLKLKYLEDINQLVIKTHTAEEIIKVYSCRINHSHKKRKDSLEGSLDRILFVAELEFPKILVPRLSQHTSKVNTECAGKSEWSKQLYSRFQSSSTIMDFTNHNFPGLQVGL